MPAVNKNGETGGLAVDLFGDPDNFIEVVVTVQYAAIHSYFIYPRNM